MMSEDKQCQEGKKAELSSPQISSSDASLSLNLTGHKCLLLYWSLSPTLSSLSHPLRFCLPVVSKLFIHKLQNYIGTKPKYALVKINSLSEEYKQCKNSKYTIPK
ncbi:BRCA1-associated ATM activator 1 [Platysternon megacephalum]|uniref:BRCA1-associated ATM activator 1 n=1 Tax=Platysternon megacephalum TaxID=55544 RepID=A0A4D9EKI7_9SAUR|nr:BRCA1-associated ATM activator 1 [Platysternon megacephalum]